MPEQLIEPQFPLSGVVRSTRFWGDMALGEKPFTPWAVNVFPLGPYNSRVRGGSRPGLTDTTDSRKTQSDRLVVVDDSIVTEGGDSLITEDGLDTIITDIGDTFITEAGEYDYITISTSMAIPTSDGRTWVDTGDDAPSELTEMCLYLDRVCMASSSSLEVYMSRQGNYLDWDISADVEDESRPALIQLVEAGEWFNEETGVTALIPYRDSALYAGTANSLWAMQGDPVSGGEFRNVSRDVGVVSAKAWCKAEGTVFFLSSRGLYAIVGNADIKPLSEDPLPEDLASVTSAVLGYRAEDNGVYMFTSGTYHWFYHIPTGSFWPFKLSSGHTPTEVYKSGRDLILICGDAAARKIGGDDDDGTDIDSHILLGPYRSAGGDMSGILTALEGALAEASGTVTWYVLSGDTAEDVAADGKTAITLHLAGNESGAQAYTKVSGTFSAGRSLRAFPRVRGQWFAVWLHSDAKWAYEWLACRISDAGRYR